MYLNNSVRESCSKESIMAVSQSLQKVKIMKAIFRMPVIWQRRN